jgi:hypothetical protein
MYRPRPMTSSLGLYVPLDDASFGQCIPVSLSMRPRTIHFLPGGGGGGADGYIGHGDALSKGRIVKRTLGRLNFLMK